MSKIQKEPLELTPDLIDILGRPCFTLIHMAQALRLAGREIPKRAEDEQAHCIHWMLSHYLKHGADWREHASAELKAAQLLQLANTAVTP